MPMCGWRLMRRAREMQEAGKPWMKLRVPSMGSTTKVGVSVILVVPGMKVSSPTKA